jgi:putative transposase
MSGLRTRRRERAHQLTTYLTREYGLVAAEKLNIAGMQQNKRLARHIADAGRGIVLAQLDYKASRAGSTFERADRFYTSSKTCFGRGTVKAMLSVRARLRPRGVRPFARP